MPIFDCKHNSSPVCPYCGKEQSNASDLDLDYDGDYVEIKCQECGLTFGVTAELIIEYTTKPINPADVREYCVANNLSIPDCVKE